MAVDYNWLFSYYNPCGGGCGTATGSVCTGGVYVNVFNRDSEAIDFAASPKVLDTFDRTAVRFRKALTEHAERTQYWEGLVHCSELDIPDNVYGEDYAVEYWCECVAGVQDRDTDKLVKVERVIWAVDRVHESRLDISQLVSIAELTGLQVFVQPKAGSDAVDGSWGKHFSVAENFCCDTLANPASGYASGTAGACLASICEKIGEWPVGIAGPQYVCHAGMSYDNENQFFHLVGWLELDGQLQLDPLTFSFVMIDSDGNEIINVTGDGADLVAGFGMFKKQVADIEFTPDETYYGVMTINDADDVAHSSSVAIPAWD